MATEFNMESSASFLMVTFHGCNLSLSLFGHRLRSGVDSRAAAERIKFVIRAAFALYSLPHPPALCGGMGTFFVGLCRRAAPACKAPLFSPPPQRFAGEGVGGGAKVADHKGSSIAVWIVGARLNSYEV